MPLYGERKLQYQREYQAKNKDRFLAYAQAKRDKGLCTVCGRRPLVTKNHCQECRERHNSKRYGRRYDYAYRKYGLTKEEGEASRKIKHCQICGRKRKLEYDHNHKSNRFRGMLCTRCNLGLGCFEDNVTSLQQAIEYLVSATEETHACID